jgi:hypothetical protein
MNIAVARLEFTQKCLKVSRKKNPVRKSLSNILRRFKITHQRINLGPRSLQPKASN